MSQLINHHLPVCRKIQDNLKYGKYNLNSKGHFDPKVFNIPETELFFGNIVSYFMMDITEEEFNDLQKIANCEELDHWFEYRNDWPTYCPLCGEKLVVICDGVNMEFKHQCSLQRGDFSVSIKTPSKKIAIGNDFISLFTDRDSLNQFNLNTFSEIQRASQFYAKINLGFLFVGNQPLHLNVENKTIVEGYNETTDIVTDLWWISFCDYDEFLKLFNDKYLNESIKDIYPDLLILDIDSEEAKLTSYIDSDVDHNIIISIN